MNDDSIPSVICIILLVLCSGYFSATETAYSCVNRSKLKALVEKGSKRAEHTLAIADRYDKLLTSALVGNNIVNVAMASISTVMFVRILPKIGASVSTLVITVLVLIFGEISPKSIAKESPEKFAMFSAPFMRVFMWILTPVNYLFTQWQAMLRRVFRLSDKKAMTQDELLMLVDEVAQDGSIDAEEESLLRSAIEFRDLEAQDILTPRLDMECISVDASAQEVAQVFTDSQFSRLPVYDGSVDNIVGILYQKDFYTGAGISSASVRELMREPVFVPQSVKIDDLLRVLQRRKSHLAVVSDEYGGTMGIVTMEDILEELVGEIWDEHDEAVEHFRQVGEHTYRVVCSEDLGKLDRFFRLNLESESECTSISGWVMEQLGRIPAEGDKFRCQDLDVTVTATDGNRVLEIEVCQNVSVPQSP